MKCRQKSRSGPWRRDPADLSAASRSFRAISHSCKTRTWLNQQHGRTHGSSLVFFLSFFFFLFRIAEIAYRQIHGASAAHANNRETYARGAVFRGGGRKKEKRKTRQGKKPRIGADWRGYVPSKFASCNVTLSGAAFAIRRYGSLNK